MTESLLEGKDEAPWDDCKVAFEFDCDPSQIWGDLSPIDGRVRHRVPAGWVLVETDGVGTRLMAIFRVDGKLRAADGIVVAALLRDIERKKRRKEATVTVA